MAGTFDTKAFLSQNYDEPNSTKTIPIPESEYDATVRSVGDPREWTNREGVKKAIVDVSWLVEDVNGRVEAVTNRKENFARQSLFLDVVIDGMGKITSLDMREGINVELGRLRAAVGLNGPGFSFQKLVGRPAHVKVGTDVDERDGTPRSKVVAVVKLGEKFGKEGK